MLQIWRNGLQLKHTDLSYIIDRAEKSNEKFSNQLSFNLLKYLPSVNGATR